MKITRSSIWLRSTVRSAGFIKPLLRLTHDEHVAQLDELEAEYAKNPVADAPAEIAGQTYRFRTPTVTDYTIVRALREEAFADAIFAALQPGDTVWDVGANIGFFSAPFGRVVGDTGQVFAFEPVPACREALNANLELNGVTNVNVMPCALSNEAGEFTMVTDDQVAAGTHQIRKDQPQDQPTVQVTVKTGDAVLAEPGVTPPNVMKIDIEGFEYDALRGMHELLRKPEVRAVFVEVHFGLLDERGQRYAPLDIVELFKDAGFKRIEWIDRSHLAANRD